MFRHIGIVVQDMDKQLEFYKNTLGLEVYYDEIEKGEFLEHIIGVKNAEAHIIKLGLNEQTIVELLDFGMSPNTQFKSLIINGFTHFAITVDDVKKICDKDILIVNQPKINPKGTVKVAFCKDPEGNFIELVECISKE